MNELKLEQGCWYWAKYREDLEYTSYGNIKGSWVWALWTDGYFRTERGKWHRGDFDTAIPCDDRGWIDAELHQPPRDILEVFAADVPDYATCYDCIHRLEGDDVWHHDDGMTVDKFTHWIPINKPQRREP